MLVSNTYFSVVAVTNLKEKIKNTLFVFEIQRHSVVENSGERKGDFLSKKQNHNKTQTKRRQQLKKPTTNK